LDQPPAAPPDALGLLCRLEQILARVHDLAAFGDDIFASGAGLAILRALRTAEAGPGPSVLCQTQLAQSLGRSQALVTRVVAQLEAIALVERRIDPFDRRRKMVALSAMGRARLAAFSAELDGVSQRAFGGAAALDLAQVAQCLDRVAEHLGELQQAQAASRRMRVA
jgi:DNA-binding MarR family transcriptional regulator